MGGRAPESHLPVSLDFSQVDDVSHHSYGIVSCHCVGLSSIKLPHVREFISELGFGGFVGLFWDRSLYVVLPVLEFRSGWPQMHRNPSASASWLFQRFFFFFKFKSHLPAPILMNWFCRMSEFLAQQVAPLHFCFWLLLAMSRPLYCHIRVRVYKSCNIPRDTWIKNVLK